MAKVDVKMPEDFLLEISRLGERTDEIVPRVLETGGEVVLKKVQSNLHSVIGSGTKYESRSTGELADSLGLSPALQDRDGNHNVKIGFSEPRENAGSSHGDESNAMIANILEYGKSGQPPKPFLKPARSASKKPCIEAMKAKLEQELSQI